MRAASCRLSHDHRGVLSRNDLHRLLYRPCTLLGRCLEAARLLHSPPVPTMATNFSSIPILDYAQAFDPATKPQFLADLRNALTNVGFYYLKNHPIPPADTDAVVSYSPRFLDLPQEEKERIRMVHNAHFFGYSRLGAELTKGKVDQREQFDFGTSSAPRWKEGDPDFMRLWGPSQVCARPYWTCIES